MNQVIKLLYRVDFPISRKSFTAAIRIKCSTEEVVGPFPTVIHSLYFYAKVMPGCRKLRGRDAFLYVCDGGSL